VCFRGGLGGIRLFAFTAEYLGYEGSRGAGIATGITAGVRFLSRVRNSLHILDTCFRARPAFYPMRTGGSFLSGKAAGT
jgi:hypothetical protein